MISSSSSSTTNSTTFILIWNCSWMSYTSICSNWRMEVMLASICTSIVWISMSTTIGCEANPQTFRWTSFKFLDFLIDLRKKIKLDSRFLEQKFKVCKRFVSFRQNWIEKIFYSPKSYIFYFCCKIQFFVSSANISAFFDISIAFSSRRESFARIFATEKKWNFRPNFFLLSPKWWSLYCWSRSGQQNFSYLQCGWV